MSKDEKGVLEQEAKARREFLKKTGAIGATAPAVALLLSTNAKQAQANMYGPSMTE